MKEISMRSVGLTAVFLCITTVLGAQDSAYTPSFEMPEGPQLVAIYVGSSTCGPCQSPELKAAIEQAKRGLRKQATTARLSFAAIGVALDWSVEEGYNFLRKSGEFDEIVTGSNWINLGALRYIWADSTATPGLPQLVVLRRTIETGAARIAINNERILLRLLGDSEIEAWVRRGLPLPPLE